MEFTYSNGARGFIVERLQRSLDINPDGVFGSQTSHAVERMQGCHGLDVTGRAGAAEFTAIGEPWPSEFERAMNLVCNFEGTSFGDCNARDIDGAGLTMGIAGFTTAHGEVQALLTRYIADRPHALAELSSNLRHALANCLTRQVGIRQWHGLFYDNNGSVLNEWRRIFKAWGACENMRQLQLGIAKERFWQPAATVAESLGFTSPRAHCFFLDVAVQNGGWRQSHMMMAKRMIDWQSEDECKALSAAGRAVAACAREQWRNDVLSRKLAIATGKGVVHGRQWDLRDHALL